MVPKLQVARLPPLKGQADNCRPLDPGSKRQQPSTGNGDSDSRNQMVIASLKGKEWPQHLLVAQVVNVTTGVRRWKVQVKAVFSVSLGGKSSTPSN